MVFGSTGFGPVSIGVVVLLALLVVASFWIAQRPRLIPALWRRIRESPIAGWFAERLGERGSALARRFSVDEVAGLALLTGLVVVAGLAAAFAEVLEDVLEGEGIAAIDEPASRWLAGHRDPWLTAALKIVTTLGNPGSLAVIMTLACGIAVWRSRTWLPALLGLIGGGGIGLVIVTAKAVVGRNRPASPFAAIYEDGFSFPSGHATGTAVVALLCAWLLSWWVIGGWPGRVAVWASAIGLTGAVGFSRVYLGVHYLSDVLAGWFLGAGWALAVILVGAWWDGSRRSAQPAPPPR
jgi:undecaprenyl-diphosphatase